MMKTGSNIKIGTNSDELASTRLYGKQEAYRRAALREFAAGG